ncbi:MAG: CrcB family protein [Halococcoides sp.]
MSTLLVGIGGIGGALARHLVGDHLDDDRHTLAVNLLGSLALGALVTIDLSPGALELLGTGFCGAFTTFSSFAFAVVRTAQRGDPWRAAGLAALHIVGAILAVVVGMVAGTVVLGSW